MNPGVDTAACPDAAELRFVRLACFGIALATLSIYFPVFRFGFLEYDDAAYVLRNADIQEGLTWTSMKAVFTNSYIASWHPMAMITHALDVSLFGMNAGMHHLMSVAYHIVNSILVLLVWYRLTGDPYRSAALAVLWVVHPQHAEAVAWISSRKDLVSTLFMLLALLSYARYVRTASYAWYGIVAMMLVLGLLAKPMLVTLPFILLLLDYWPLNRIETRSDLTRRVFEKVPLFVVCALFMIVTQAVQSEGGAVRTLDEAPVAARLSNVPIAYSHYFIKAFYPSSLSIYYPHPLGQAEAWKVLGGLALISTLSIAAALQWRRRPFVFVGWFWFVGSLVPVIGLVQFGTHGMADRYTYLAHLGLFTAAVWLGGELYERLPGLRKVVAASVLIVAVLLSLVSARYLMYFRDDVVLFTYVEDVVGPSATQTLNLGNGLMQRGAYAEALVVFEKGYDLKPMAHNVYNNAGVCYLQLGRYDLARETFAEGARLNPGDERATYNVRYADAMLQEANEQIEELQHHLKEIPEDIDAMVRLARRLYNVGRHQEAEQTLLTAKEQRPEDAAIIAQLGDVYSAMDRHEQAAELYERALGLGDESGRLLYLAARATAESGDTAQSREYIRRALALAPPSLDAWMLSRRITK